MQLLRTLAAGLLPLFVLELVLRVAGWQAPTDLRRHPSLFPPFPDFYEPDRDLGWKLKPDLAWTGQELGTGFTTDAAGHRTTTRARAARTASAAVDCLGDSSTFGWAVGDDETYAAVLDARLASAGVLDGTRAVRNLGVPGYTVSEASILAARHSAHAPVTLVMVGFNDHFQTTRTRATSLRMRRLGYACFTSRLCTLLFAWMPPPELRPIAVSYVPDVSPEEYRRLLTATVRALRDARSQPVLLVYPSLVVRDEAELGNIAGTFNQQPDILKANVGAHPQYQELTRAVAADEHATIVDLAPMFDAAGNEGLHVDWVHPNRAGHALIASALEGPVTRALASAGSSR